VLLPVIFSTSLAAVNYDRFRDSVCHGQVGYVYTSMKYKSAYVVPNAPYTPNLKPKPVEPKPKL